jgi:capsular polysaccharide biosynthesis protein
MGAGERVLDDIALMAAIHEAQIVAAAVVSLTVSLPNYVSETRAAVASSTTSTASARAIVRLMDHQRLRDDDNYRVFIPSSSINSLSPRRLWREIDGSFCRI